MATIHIKEIMEYLAEKGEGDSLPNQGNPDGFFLELKFDDPTGKKVGVIDEEFKDEVITVDCPYGTVTILFDDEGQLKTIELC
ncbi:MAG: hypothetical protein KUG81_03695 [Gammaproteobacteria bacterium]|nr:hypothetical protein [Gammaproteobacteria bacterium]